MPKNRRYWLLLSLVLGGCSTAAGLTDEPETGRALLGAQPPAIRAAHAKALFLELETADLTARSWSSEGVSGTITAGAPERLGDLVCRPFTQEITAGGKTARDSDRACWFGGWIYDRASDAGFVLTPAFNAPEGVYRVRSGGTLKAVARATGTDPAALATLNPGLPNRLPPGTLVLLP